MSKELINNLLDALKLSPDNVPLRSQVADLMLQEKMYAESAAQYQQILEKSYGNTKAQVGLATCYFYLQKNSAAIIIYEQLQQFLSLDDQVRYIKCSDQGKFNSASDQLISTTNRTQSWFKDDEIDAQLRMPSAAAKSDDDWNEEEDYFMEKPSIKFEDVGGMKRIKEEISIKIIHHYKILICIRLLVKRSGRHFTVWTPGCGKTFIAKATAGEINAKFINIGLHDILDMWMGNSEKNLHGIFEMARQNTPCVLFFDEVDAMGASRSDMKQSGMRHVINQFLAEMDGVDSNNDGVVILAATNAPWSVDGAFRRPGRFDRIIFVEPPDEEAREEILKSILKDKPATDIDTAKVAAACKDYSGADLKAVVDIAVEDKLVNR
jgi:tetratricopeptide (TPR) repeat protein